jgi:hypothetical protein
MSKAEVEARIDLLIGKRKGPRYISKRQKKKGQKASP